MCRKEDGVRKKENKEQRKKERKNPKHVLLVNSILHM
jgi:hypothetical protein